MTPEKSKSVLCKAAIVSFFASLLIPLTLGFGISVCAIALLFSTLMVIWATESDRVRYTLGLSIALGLAGVGATHFLSQMLPDSTLLLFPLSYLVYLDGMCHQVSARVRESYRVAQVALVVGVLSLFFATPGWGWFEGMKRVVVSAGVLISLIYWIRGNFRWWGEARCTAEAPTGPSL